MMVTLDLVSDKSGQTLVQRPARAHSARKVCLSQLHLPYPILDLRLREGSIAIMFPRRLDSFEPRDILIREEFHNMPLLDLHFWHCWGNKVEMPPDRSRGKSPTRGGLSVNKDASGDHLDMISAGVVLCVMEIST
jgi:hypothetical protein